MYHILCSGFVRFESMDVIRGNFRLKTGEDSSCKDGGGLEHCSGELDFMHQDAINSRTCTLFIGALD